MGLPQRLLRGLAVAGMMLAFTGCVLPGQYLITGELACQPVSQVGAAWSNKLNFVADPAHAGTPAPGLAGRLYLFGATPDFPFIGDGGLVVDLFDDTVHPGEPPVQGGKHIEQWRFDPATLKRLARKDTIGDGYTLFLPWGTYKPDIKNVHLVTRYEPKNGPPVYAPANALHIDHSGAPPGAAVPQTNQAPTAQMNAD